MFGKTLQKIEMQSLKFFLGYICKTSLMNPKIAFCFDKNFCQVKHGLNAFHRLSPARPHGWALWLKLKPTHLIQNLC